MAFLIGPSQILGVELQDFGCGTTAADRAQPDFGAASAGRMELFHGCEHLASKRFKSMINGYREFGISDKIKCYKPRQNSDTQPR